MQSTVPKVLIVVVYTGNILTFFAKESHQFPRTTRRQSHENKAVRSHLDEKKFIKIACFTL